LTRHREIQAKFPPCDYLFAPSGQIEIQAGRSPGGEQAPSKKKAAGGCSSMILIAADSHAATGTLLAQWLL